MARPDEERDRRLADALRLNLRRRKEQARAEDTQTPPEPVTIKPSSEQP